MLGCFGLRTCRRRRGLVWPPVEAAVGVSRVAAPAAEGGNAAFFRGFGEPLDPPGVGACSACAEFLIPGVVA